MTSSFLRASHANYPNSDREKWFRANLIYATTATLRLCTVGTVKLNQMQRHASPCAGWREAWALLQDKAAQY